MKKTVAFAVAASLVVGTLALAGGLTQPGGSAPLGVGVVPAGCTDNAIVRADGAAGNAQCSSFIIADGASTITSAQMIDPYVPVDGTMNVTGALAVSSGATVGGQLGVTSQIKMLSGSTLDILDPSANIMGTFTDGGTVGDYASTGYLKAASGATSTHTGFQAGDANWGMFMTGSDLVFTGAPGAGRKYQWRSNSLGSGSTIFAVTIDDGTITMLPKALSIADDGAGTAAAYTALPAGGIIEVTCSDANGCNWTPTETSAVNGETHYIVNVGSNNLVMKNTAGQVLLTGGADVTLGTRDSMKVYYSTALSAWVQITGTANN